MEHIEIQKLIWRPSNPHDRFCRHTAYNPFYAPDFLRSYGDPILAKYLDLDHLQEAPTTHLSDELKESIMDASLATRLIDGKNAAEVLLHLEHKSRPSRTAVIQLLLEAALALHFRWSLENKTESAKYAPPIPLMILVYNGLNDWDIEILFQDFYQDLPEELHIFVIQFKLFLINLRRFLYGHLPGKQSTQAIVESLKRATDGTFVSHLPNIFEHVARSDLDERRRLSLTRSIASYITWNDEADPEYITDTVKTVFKRQEGIIMSQTVKKGLAQEWLEIGEAKGEARGIAKSTLMVLQKRFARIPPEVTKTLDEMTDLTALSSHLGFAVTCASMDEFIDSLK